MVAVEHRLDREWRIWNCSIGLRPCYDSTINDLNHPKDKKGRAHGFVGDEVAVLAQDVGADLYNVLVTSGVPKKLEHPSSGVLYSF